MKNIVIAILCFMSLASFASENKDPNQTLFQTAECFGKQGYCEFVDFRGMSNEIEFDKLPNEVDFYTGPIGVNGITCNEWDAVCTNSNSEVVGLNPNFKDDYGNSFKEQSSSQTPVLQQAAEPPFRFDVRTVNVGSIGYPIPQNQMLFISEVGGLVINKIIINEGSKKCMQFDENTSRNGTLRNNLDMGDELSLILPLDCRLIKFEVITNMGTWKNIY